VLRKDTFFCTKVKNESYYQHVIKNHHLEAATIGIGSFGNLAYVSRIDENTNDVSLVVRSLLSPQDTPSLRSQATAVWLHRNGPLPRAPPCGARRGYAPAMSISSPLDGSLEL
jgi:hypothetical protein